MTITEIAPTPVLDDTDPGEGDGFGHIVRKPDLDRAAVTGEAIVALCGKIWRARPCPDHLPICQACSDAAFSGPVMA